MRGRVALITGGSRGIGLGIAEALRGAGAQVCITGRKPDDLEAAVSNLGGGDDVLAVVGASHDAAHREEAVRTVVQRFGHLDVLVNDAGTNPQYGPLVEADVELGPKVRVNAIAPAVVKTRFARALYEGREEEVAADYPLRRLGTTDDTASIARFLLSDEASWITGETVVVDGGVSIMGRVG